MAASNHETQTSMHEHLQTLIALDTLIVIVDSRSAFPQAIHESMMLPNASLFTRCDGPNSPSIYPTQVS
jgi:hypothetical protein